MVSDTLRLNRPKQYVRPDDIWPQGRGSGLNVDRWHDMTPDDFSVYAQPWLTLEVRALAPAAPVNGMIVYADGVGWNPGAGAGFYGYEAGAWVKL